MVLFKPQKEGGIISNSLLLPFSKLKGNKQIHFFTILPPYHPQLVGGQIFTIWG